MLGIPISWLKEEKKNVKPGSSYPNFFQMSDNEAKEYILKYVQKHFTTRGRLIIKLPIDLREDAIQSVFIDLYETRFKYDPAKARFTTFAYYRGMGVVTKLLESHKRKPLEILHETIPDNKHFIKHQIYKDQIKTILQSLNVNEEKRIFFMRFIKKMSISEIASRLNTSTGDVKKVLKIIQKKIDY